MTKLYIKKLFFLIMKNNFFWSLIDNTFSKFYHFHKKASFYRNRSNIPKKEIGSKSYLNFKKSIKTDLVILNGPFSGMKYPSLKSSGSVIFPKLLGSYEKEIQVFIDYIQNQDYENIIDIGCAEGYYAVGLGMKLKKAKVFAFDDDENAQKQCKKMAKLNNVEINIHGFFTKTSYEKYTQNKKSLIFMDCEGYEKYLIDKEIATKHQNCDFLIEAHDFIDISITDHILNSFRMTHKIEVIESIDDISKAYSYEFKELSGMSLLEKKQLLSEYRPTTMRWIFAKSK